jgi:hypothetical protein
MGNGHWWQHPRTRPHERCIWIETERKLGPFKQSARPEVHQ